MAQNLDEDMRQSRAQVQHISAMLVEKIPIIERMQCLEKHKTLRIEDASSAAGAAAALLLGEHEGSSASREGPKQDKEDNAAAHSSAGDKHRTTLIDISGLENWSNSVAAPRSVNRRSILLVSCGQRESETKA